MALDIIVVKDYISDEDVVKIFKINRPQWADDIRQLFELKKVGSGLFRNVYHIKNSDLVVKVPNDGNNGSLLEDCISHANQEFQVLKELRKKKYLPIHRYLPKILYFDKLAGITIMPKYKKYENENVAMILEHLIQDVYSKGEETDLHSSNIGQYKDEYDVYHPVLLDLGYVRK